MRNKKGFTLTEVLLAVMIVGLISIALASLTRAAARESGVGRTKIMLRNNLSMFMRTLRKDLASSSYVSGVYGWLPVGTTPVILVQMAKNMDSKGNVLQAGEPKEWITYCFKRGTDNANIQPSTAYRGGIIYRIVGTTKITSCPTTYTQKQVVLQAVKFLVQGTASSATGYHSPLFMRNNFSRLGRNSVLTVRIITELNSKPLVNDVVEEIFTLPNGY